MRSWRCTNHLWSAGRRERRASSLQPPTPRGRCRRSSRSRGSPVASRKAPIEMGNRMHASQAGGLAQSARPCDTLHHAGEDIGHRVQARCLVVRDVDLELVLERHHHLDPVDARGAEIVIQGGYFGDALAGHMEPLGDDPAYAVAQVSHDLPPVPSRLTACRTVRCSETTLLLLVLRVEAAAFAGREELRVPGRRRTSPRCGRARCRTGRALHRMRRRPRSP